jgi:mannosyltransferase OCH1-like enzyme
MYLDGEQALEKLARQPRAHFRRDWWLSCEHHNPGWTRRLWDQQAAEALLAERYPWMLDTWRNLGSRVLQSDALRPLILHEYGGLYLVRFG